MHNLYKWISEYTRCKNTKTQSVVRTTVQSWQRFTGWCITGHLVDLCWQNGEKLTLFICIYYLCSVLCILVPPKFSECNTTVINTYSRVLICNIVRCDIQYVLTTNRTRQPHSNCMSWSKRVRKDIYSSREDFPDLTVWSGNITLMFVLISIQHQVSDVSVITYSETTNMMQSGN